MRMALVVTLLLCCTVCAAGAKEIVVAQDGTGDFRTVQEAVDAAPDHSSIRTAIHIKPGTYPGQVIVPETKTNLRFMGDDNRTTILTYAVSDKDPLPEGQPEKYKSCGLVVLADGFKADRITFRHTAGVKKQGIALRIDADRAVFQLCHFLSWKNTLRLDKGRQYFRDCYIEGCDNFIGGGATAVFDQCRIFSKNGGHVTAAKTPEDQPFGFVFIKCRLMGEGKPADLGRPWGPYASVTFIKCEMGEHILPKGWDNWQDEEKEDTSRCSEYLSTGPGANPSKRTLWSRQLTQEEAEAFTVRNVLAGSDGWNPLALPVARPTPK